jgi:hypothetical protein
MQSSRVWANWARQAALASGSLCFGAVLARAQTLTVSGSPSGMQIVTAVAGMAPSGVSNAATTYLAKAKNKNTPVKIMARLNSPMPAGMALTITMEVPAGATNREILGNITVITNVQRVITYNLTATPAAGIVPVQSRTVTFTMLAWP